MSILFELSEDNIDGIVDILDRYEKKVADAEPIFKLEGKRLEEACRTLPHYQASYDQHLADMKMVERWVEIHKERLVAKIWKKYNEGYSRQLSARDIQAYLEGDKEIVQVNQVLCTVGITKAHLASIVDALKQMAFSLSNITKLRVAELDSVL